MSLNRRITQLESEFGAVDQHQYTPCDVCGAPDNALIFPGVHVVIAPRKSDERNCEGCGRVIDPQTGKPIIARFLTRFVRARSSESDHQG